MYQTTVNRFSVNTKAFFMIFLITFSVFVFTSDGHRYTFDESLSQEQSLRMATLEPHPDYVQGESRPFFEYPSLYPPHTNFRPICENFVLCSHATVVHSLTQAPFIAINELLHIITFQTKELDLGSYQDLNYTLWRNSLDPSFTFMELFYGPFFCALSVSVFFLVARTFFSIKTSMILSFLFAFSTIIWAYSQTSLNVIPTIFFIILGYYFFRRFQNKFSYKSILVCAGSLGVAFLARNDVILFLIPLFFYFIYEMIRHKNKILNTVCFVVPLISSYGMSELINKIRIGFETNTGDPSPVVSAAGYAVGYVADIPYELQIPGSPLETFGLLFSPGVGLLIFAPILITVFLSFPDFFKRYKLPCLFFLSVIGFFVLYYAQNGFWHGLNAWSARYLLITVPFFLLPLGASIEQRKNISFKLSILVLAIPGAFFNLVYLLQDVSWFVWGVMATRSGHLYDVGGASNLWISPLVLWTFEYSQLTQSIINLLFSFEHDIFLLHIFGAGIYSLIVSIVLVPLIFVFFQRTFRYTEQ